MPGTMRVKVLYFGVLKEWSGREEEAVELEEGCTVGEALGIVRERTSNGNEATGMWKALAVAVNREYAAAGRVLVEGDEVALLPPVSGGRGGVR